MCKTIKSVNEVFDDQTYQDSANNYDSDEYNSQSYAFLASLSSTKGDSPWIETVKLQDTFIEFKVDTGADVTVINETQWKDLNLPLEKPDKVLMGPGNEKLNVLGKFQTALNWRNSCSEQTIYVIKHLNRPLLGRPAVRSLKMIAELQNVDAEKPLTLEAVKQKFPKLFKGLGKLQEEYNIKVKSDAKPFAISTPRRVPLPLLDKVKQELHHMQEQGVISPVDEPSDWCAGMVVVPKPNGNVRICVDLTKLNEAVCREKLQMPSVEHTLAQVSGANVFSKLDANSGFFQIPLSQESRLYTTFITPFGRFCYNRLPFGITSAPEHYQKRMSRILTDQPGSLCQMDDILVYGVNEKEHNRCLFRVLQKLSDSGVTLNEDKCIIAKPEVPFLGQLLGKDGIKSDPEKLRAITEIERPSNVKDVRRILGMVNQLGKFIPNLAEMTKPLRDLLSKKNLWTWGRHQEKTFQTIKQSLSSQVVLAYYDMSKPTMVSADSSSYGLGSVLLQQHDNIWKPVAYASRSLTPVEQRYGQIEKECLAITWSCEKFQDFLIGLKFHVETDHKPLVSILGSKNLDDMTPRIQRFRMRLMKFHFSIFHVPGKLICTADTLSRASLSNSVSRADSELEQDVKAYVSQVLQSLPATEK